MKIKTYTIIPTEKFNKELHQQILYVAMQFSKETALQVKENIQTAILNLQLHPYMGNTPKIRNLKDNDFRMLILNKLIIFYTVVEETKTIYLLSILDQRQVYKTSQYFRYTFLSQENVYRFFIPIIYGYLYR